MSDIAANVCLPQTAAGPARWSVRRLGSIWGDPMAEQVVNIVLRQSSSGAPVSISLTWTSDAHIVMTTRHLARQRGEYTMDARMINELGAASRQIVADMIRLAQLW